MARLDPDTTCTSHHMGWREDQSWWTLDAIWCCRCYVPRIYSWILGPYMCISRCPTKVSNPTTHQETAACFPCPFSPDRHVALDILFTGERLSQLWPPTILTLLFFCVCSYLLVQNRDFVIFVSVPKPRFLGKHCMQSQHFKLW